MSKPRLITCGVLSAIIFIAWNLSSVYKPSKDGIREEEIALEEMQRYCITHSYNCNGLVVQSKIPAIPTQICIDKNGSPVCKNGVGFWEFVIELQSGSEYLVAVLPNHSFEIFGFSSEITPLKDDELK